MLTFVVFNIIEGCVNGWHSLSTLLHNKVKKYLGCAVVVIKMAFFFFFSCSGQITTPSDRVFSRHFHSQLEICQIAEARYALTFVLLCLEVQVPLTGIKGASQDCTGARVIKSWLTSEAECTALTFPVSAVCENEPTCPHFKLIDSLNKPLASH